MKGHKLPTVREAHRWWSYDRQGKLIIDFLSSLEERTLSPDEVQTTALRQTSEISIDDKPTQADRFVDPGNDVLLSLDIEDLYPDAGKRNRSYGVPIGIVESICHMVFTPNYQESQSAMSLSAIDYLQDLEWTRRGSLRAAAKRLCITQENWREVLKKDKLALEWVELVQKQELTIESLFAKAYVDMRIWVCLNRPTPVSSLTSGQTMVTELHSGTFYKPDLLALLNTLFPPSKTALPNDSINPNSLAKYRNVFYRYIRAVEANGAKVMGPFINQLLVPGASHSWTQTRENLDTYFELAGAMIDQGDAVKNIEFFRGKEDDELVPRSVKHFLEYGNEPDLTKEVERITATLEHGYVTNPYMRKEKPTKRVVLQTDVLPLNHNRSSSSYSQTVSSESYSHNGSQKSPKTPVTPVTPVTPGDLYIDEESVLKNTSSNPASTNTLSGFQFDLREESTTPIPNMPYNSGSTIYSVSTSDVSLMEPLSDNVKKSRSIGRLAARLRSFTSSSNLREGYKNRMLKTQESTPSFKQVFHRFLENIISRFTMPY
jgi:hypothetical protein